jgi:mannobiose 2-epimerase
MLDNGKVVYGQSFAIYALATYTLATGDPRGLDYAERTFDLLQRYCADVARGGYYENLEPDWQLSPDGFCAGDRKSLDIHMHLLECFTVLAQASGKEIHRRRLQEVIDVIHKHMIDPESGCGGNQYDLAFRQVPAIAIHRTWNADREGESVETPTDTTSYGHNVELAWLLVRAGEILGKARNAYEDVVRRLVDHSLRYGLDRVNGGLFRDGPHAGPALVRDKEFWQNAEALVGYLDAFEVTGDQQYFEAFELVWAFVWQHMINHGLGEWMTLVSESGEPLIPAVGNPWKACYHSGRAVYESIRRIDMLMSNTRVR